MAIGVTDTGISVGHGTANGNIDVFFLIYPVAGRSHGEFCGAIAIDNLDIRLSAGQHLFTAHQHITHGQLRILIKHSHAHLRGKRGMDDAMLDDVVLHLLHIAAQFLRQDMNFSPGGDGTEQILQRCIKGKTRMHGMNALFRDSKINQPPFHIGTQGTVTLHYSLGTSRGAGSINHIGAPLRHCAVNRLCLWIFCYGLRHRVFGQNSPRSRVLQHVSNTVLRICRVNGHIGCPQLFHGNHTGQEFLNTVHAQGYKVALFGSLFPQPGCYAVGHLLQFPVGILSCAVHNGRMFRSFFHLLEEHIHPGFGHIIHIGRPLGQS